MRSQTQDGVLPAADLTLALYLQPHAVGRRVLWIGSAAGGGPDRLARRGRRVRLLATDAGARDAEAGGRLGSEAQRRLRVSRFRPGPLAFRPESYDLVIIPDTGPIEDAPEERLEDIRRIVASQGMLVLGTRAVGNGKGVPAHDALSYERLYDVLRRLFESVQVVAQAQFNGYALAELGSETNVDDVVLDGSLLGDRTEPPLRVLGICGPEPLSIDPYAVVQVPGSSVDAPRERSIAAGAGDSRIADLEEQLATRQREVDATNEHAEELESQVATHTKQNRELRDELEAIRKELSTSRESGRDDLGNTGEYVRLEELLAERGRRVQELELESTRLGTMVRDLIEEMEELRSSRPAAHSSHEGRASASQRAEGDFDAAVRRALEAEAARAELQFQVDELSAKLVSKGGAAPALDPDQSKRREAELIGAVRGLRSRVLELEEMRSLVEARLQLAEFDLEAAAQQRLELERELAAVREQLELEIVRTGTLRRPGASSAASSTDFEVSRLSALVLALEAERSVSHDGPTALLQLEGERAGLLARLEDREAALRDAQSSLALARTHLKELAAAADTDRGRAGYENEVDALRAALELCRSEQRELETRASEHTEKTRRSNDLVAMLAAREALVSRLQMDLAHEEETARMLAERIERHAEENTRLREALVSASDASDQREQSVQRAHSLEAELDRAKESKTSLLAERDAAHSALTELRRTLVGLEGAISGSDRNAALDITSAGMDVPTMDGSDEPTGNNHGAGGSVLDPAEKETLQRELLTLQARVARLGEELLEEREARRALEGTRGMSAGGSSDVALTEVEAQLSARNAEIASMRTRVMDAERESRSLREACAFTRSRLEELLGTAASQGDPSTAESIGALLRVLNVS